MSPGEKVLKEMSAYIPCSGAWTMWSCLCSHKQMWHHLPDDFPQPQHKHQQCHVHENDHTNE
jgi:hypothetical protein